MLHLFAFWHAALLRRQGGLFPFVPVAFGLGIGLFFALRFEPGGLIWLCLLAALLLAALARWLGPGIGTVLMAAALVCLGGFWSGWRSYDVAAPVLAWRYYGPIEGRIIGIDRSASDAVRLTLDQVVLSRTPPQKTPVRVRVSLHGDQSHFHPQPKMRVILTGHLGPPGGPVEPGGFDFQRHSWFLQLGGVGYTRAPVMVLAPAPKGASVAQARYRLTQALLQRLDGDVGAVAAAVITGDRSAIGEATVEALRATNLAHLLAISGLHMGLLAGVLFGGARLGLALVPGLSMRISTKKFAAGFALLGATAYLMISGGAVATERAYVMVAVALIAVLAGRRAISLRAVALAAMVVLGLTPEALLSPGFQMSFSATTALVAAFGLMRDRGWRLGPKPLRPVVALVVSSAVAGLATAPFAAAHFNMFSRFGLIANLLAVPVMGSVVAPAAVAAGVLAPLGMEGPALWVMEQGLSWILWVAHGIAGWEGTVRTLPQPQGWVLPVLSLGALWAVLWTGGARWGGVAMVAVCLIAWSQVERPLVLVSDNGGLVGVRTDNGRALSKARGSGFVAEVWLENDGDPATQPEAAARWGQEQRVLGQIIRHATGKKTVSQASCAPREILVVNATPPDGLPCLIFSPEALRASGSRALSVEGTWHTDRAYRGARIWTPWAAP